VEHDLLGGEKSNLYARGTYGLLMTMAILALSLGCLALLVGLAASRLRATMERKTP
jgi:hypothetical protein